MKAIWTSLALVASVAVACGGSRDVADRESNATFELRALSYNSALAPGFEPFTSERKPHIETALVSLASQLDLLCVQEYWVGSDFDALASKLADNLPNRFRQAPKPGSGSCNEHDLSELGSCLAGNCAEQSGVELVGCAQTQCAAAIEAVDGGCLGCFLDHLDDHAFSQCAATAPSDPALFGGAFDVGLLSRYPLSHMDTLEYDAYFVRASALYAQVDVPGLGAVDTFCTHLGSSLGVIPYHGPHGSWDGEHAYQVAQLMAFIANKSNGKNAVLVLGDLNMGPESAGPPAVSAELPLDYQLVISSGLVDAVSTPFCTTCSDNALRGDRARDLFIDHALLRGFEAQVTADRQLQQTFLLDAPQAGTVMNLSDHYGLRVELRSR